MFLNYDDYAEMGGRLSEAQFGALELRARQLINRMTHGRIADEAPVRACVKYAMLELIGAMAADRGRSGREVAAMSNDGVSVTFASGSSTPVSRYAVIVRSWLEGETDGRGVPLLYCGVDE